MYKVRISFIILLVEFAAEWQASLQEFAASGTVEVRENGGRVAPSPECPGRCAARAKSPFFIFGPSSSIHPSTDDLLRYLSPELEVVRIGLAESWRSGLRRPCADSLSLRTHPIAQPRMLFHKLLFHREFFRTLRASTGRITCPTDWVQTVTSLNFSTTIRHAGTGSLVDVSGRLTSFETGALRDSISRLLKQGPKNIVRNLSGLKYLDSSGIGELVREYVSVVKHGGQMKVVGSS